MVRFGRSISTHFVISRQIRVWPPDTFLSISSFVSSNSFQFFLTSFDWFFNYVCCCFVFQIYFIRETFFFTVKQRMCRVKPVDFPIAVSLLMQKSPRICQHNQLWHRCTMPSERKWVYYGRVLANTPVSTITNHTKFNGITLVVGAFALALALVRQVKIGHINRAKTAKCK